jgi:hypothetical protein
MPIRKSLIVPLVGIVMCAGWLVACSHEHKPIETDKLFEVKSTFGDDFKVNTKGPKDIDPKMLGPQKLPPGVTFDPADCADYVASGRLPKGIRGKMSVISADGEGNRFVSIAVQADKDVPFDSEAAKNCQHVTFEAGKISGLIDEVDAPHIDGAKTIGTHREITATVGEGEQHSREVYNFAAYLGDWLVLVTANPLTVKGQPPTPVDADRARQLLTDSVSALRSK